MFGLLVGLFNYNYYSNYMVAKLFTYKESPGKFGKGSNETLASGGRRKSIATALKIDAHDVDVELEPRSLNPCVMLFHKCVPGRCQHLLYSK